LSGKGFFLTLGTFGSFAGIYGLGKKIEDGIAVFTVEFVDWHCDSLEPISKMHLTPNSFVVSLLKKLTY
jgi:hypothetical protein